MRFILFLSIGSFWLGHHRIVTYGKDHCSFVPHSHANCTFVPFWTFVLLSPPSAFLFEFYSGSSIHSVLLCERRIYFSSHERRGTFGNLKFMLLILCFDMYFPLGVLTLDSFYIFWNYGMGLFIYDILFTLLPFRGSFAVTPLDI